MIRFVLILTFLHISIVAMATNMVEIEFTDNTPSELQLLIETLNQEPYWQEFPDKIKELEKALIGFPKPKLIFFTKAVLYPRILEYKWEKKYHHLPIFTEILWKEIQSLKEKKLNELLPLTKWIYEQLFLQAEDLINLKTLTPEQESKLRLSSTWFHVLNEMTPKQIDKLLI